MLELNGLSFEIKTVPNLQGPLLCLFRDGRYISCSSWLCRGLLSCRWHDIVIRWMTLVSWCGVCYESVEQPQAAAGAERNVTSRVALSGTYGSLEEPGPGRGTWDRDTLPTCPPALCKLAVPHLSEIWFGATERIGCLFLETSPGSREEVNVQRVHLFWNNPIDLLQTYVITNTFSLLVYQSTCIWLLKSLQDSLNQKSSILFISIFALT